MLQKEISPEPESKDVETEEQEAAPSSNYRWTVSTVFRYLEEQDSVAPNSTP